MTATFSEPTTAPHRTIRATLHNAPTMTRGHHTIQPTHITAHYHGTPWTTGAVIVTGPITAGKDSKSGGSASWALGPGELPGWLAGFIHDNTPKEGQ